MIGGHFTRVTSHTYTLACILKWKKLKSFPFAFQFQCENEFVWLWSLYCSSLEIWAVMVLIDCFFISTIKLKLHFSLACSGIRIYTGRFKKPRASESEYVWKWVLTVLMYLWRVVDPIWLTLRASACENEIKGSKLSQNHPSSAFFSWNLYILYSSPQELRPATTLHFSLVYSVYLNTSRQSI